jgi:excinuclease ABC subunit B
MVIMYADVVTGSMRYTIEETERRRKIQETYNRQHGIEPKTIISSVKDSMQQHLRNSGYIVDDYQQHLLATAEEVPFFSSVKDLEKEIRKLEEEMRAAAKELAFEKAAELRDRIKKIRLMEIELG